MSRRIEGLEGTSQVAQIEVDRLVECLPEGGRMLEIGTWHGVTAAEIADARPRASIVCVDPFVAGRSTDAGDKAKWEANARCNMTLFVGTSQEYVEAVTEKYPGLLGRFDLVMVDGSHSYPDALEDFRSAARVLKDRGIIAAHDFDRGGDVAVKRAVQEFCRQFPFHMYDRVHQLALLRSDNAL